MRELPEALKAWGNYKQFCLWEMQGDKKVPISAKTGLACDPHDPANQLTWTEVVTAAYRLGCQIGFVFTRNDPFFFIDIDDALLPNGEWKPHAKKLCAMFPGAAIEVSQSGRGLHIFGCYSGELPHSNKNAELHIELYTKLRYCAVTFLALVGDVWTDHGVALATLVAQYFPSREASSVQAWTSTPDPTARNPSDDEELIRRMLASSDRGEAAFLGAQANRASLRQLWEGDTGPLGQHYPSSTDNPFDHSSADAALCSHLAYWTGKDCERIERLFNRSGLTRDKWYERPDYRRGTILFAVTNCKNVYIDPRAEPGPAPADAMPASYQLLTPNLQETYFAGCTYVRSKHEVFMPDGTLLSPPKFKARMGGYVFAIDGISKTTTRNAFEALTESQVIRWPQADGVCFRPEERPGSIVMEEGLGYLNTYIPADVACVEGDVSPYLDLLAKLLPVEHDRSVLLAYMAGAVQNPGAKFQWAPVVQGAPGNGKTFLITALSKAIGMRYTHLPNADQLASRFNGWVQNNLLIGVEEICVPGRPQIVEMLKTLITNSRVKIEAKGIDERTGDNRANFFFCSNWQDGVTKIKNDRRYCVFFTSQQSVEDLTRDGMDGTYFYHLYEWLHHKGGGAAVTHFLQHYPIPDMLNPAVYCQRAPNTSSTAAAIVASRGLFEQEVIEACEEGRYGFKNGWLSSCQIADMIDEKLRNERIPRNRRKELLARLGFIPHPGLTGGRGNKALPKEDGRKPIIYVHNTNAAAMALRGQAAIDAYCQAQEG